MTTCSIWTGSTDRDGYGRRWINGKLVRTHRLVMLELHVPIAGMVVMHRCDTPACVNPDHLTVGTQAQNLADASRKGRFPNQRKTHCPQGHEYTEANTYVRARGSRECLICVGQRNRRAYQRRKENRT